MKKMKKLVALIIATAMVLSMMSIAAFAEEPTTYTITINKDSTDKAAHTYGAYQIFKGDLSEENGAKTLSNIQWGDNVDSAKAITELKKISQLSGIADSASAVDVAKAIGDLGLEKDDAVAQAIADAFDKAVTSPAKTASVAATATSGTIGGLAAGYYLVKDTAAVTGEGAKTRFILEVVSDVAVTEKANIPSVTKKVKEKNDTTGRETDWQDAADYDIGDEVPYKLEGTLPGKFDEYDTYTTYTFIDTLSAGLTPPSADKVKVTLNTEDGTDITSMFDVTVDGQVLKAALKEGVDLKKSTNPAFTASSKIIVTYKAVLNESAKIGSEGNPNTVKLEFSNNPNYDGSGDNDKGTTPEDKVIVFTYEIKALKVEPDGDDTLTADGYANASDDVKANYIKVGDKYVKVKELPGAGFTLYKKVNGEFQKIGNEITGVTTFEFKGTDAGEYKLVETTVPTGYNKAEDITFTINAEYNTDSPDPKLTKLEVTPETAGFTVTTTTNSQSQSISTDGVISGKILNQKGSELPSTGGIGTTIFYVIGAILVIGAGVVLVTRRRMEA